MTKRELVIKLARETGLPQVDVYDILRRTLNHFIDALARGERIEFRDFGVFEVCVRKGRIGRNPKRPEITVMIPNRKVVKFKPGRIMKLKVCGPVSQASPPTSH